MGDQEIRVGSVVRLKSGGPLMTVSEVSLGVGGSEKQAWCDWFVQDKAPWKKENGNFPLSSLKVIEP